MKIWVRSRVSCRPVAEVEFVSSPSDVDFGFVRADFAPRSHSRHRLGFVRAGSLPASRALGFVRAVLLRSSHSGHSPPATLVGWFAQFALTDWAAGLVPRLS